MKALSFEGSGLEYFKIWIINILLTLVTLGLYYPWAKVRNYRYFYANTKLDGRSFEYHATGKQLFKGFIIAMALFISYVVIQQVSPIGSVVVFLLFFMAFPWIIWRSLKFNMRMTSFSNVRFSFKGELGQAYFNYMLLPFLTFLSLYAAPIIIAVVVGVSGTSISILTILLLGIFSIALLALALGLFAYMKKRNTCYTINGIQYGQGQFSVNVKTETFILILLKAVGFGILLVGASMVLAGLLSFAFGIAEDILLAYESSNDPEAIQAAMGNSMLLLIGVIYFGMIISSMLVGSYLIARQRAYIFANMTLDKTITFSSTLKASKLAWVLVTNFLAIILSLSLALPWAKVRMAKLVLENTWVDTQSGFDEYLTQKQTEQSSLGEQIGDAFDIDVGIGI